MEKEPKKEGIKRRCISLLLFLLVSILGINLISAYTGSFGYFGSFTTEDVFILVIFIVIFFVINSAFSKFFRDSQGQPMKSAWIPALALALGATYGIWETGFNPGDFFFDIGIPAGILDIIAPLLVIVFLIFLIKKWGFSAVLLILGGGLILASWLDWVYESTWLIIIGAVLVILGIIIRIRFGGSSEDDDYSDYEPGAFEKGSRKGKTTLQIVVRGRGKTKPKEGIYYYNKTKTIRLKAIPEKDFGFSYWRINGRVYKKKIVKIKMDRGHYAVAVFDRSREPKKGTPEPSNPKRTELLKKEAKRYKKKSKKSNKPLYNGTWANFIRYLRKKRHLGKNEADICKRLNISQRDFVNIFNKYGRLK